MNNITIIIPTYNAEDYIIETLISVKEQTYQNFTIIIIDDQSTDSTYLKIIDYFKENLISNFRIEKMLKNSGGPATPRNLGIKLAQTKYIAFLDSDDIWHPKKLEIQINTMVSQNLDIVSTLKENFTDKHNISFQAIEEGLITSEELDYTSMLSQNRIVLSSTLVRRAKIENLLFSTDRNLIAVEDYDLWLRLLKDRKIKGCVTKEKLTFYRKHAENISSNKINQACKILNLLKSHENKKYIYYFTLYCFKFVIEKIKRKS